MHCTERENFLYAWHVEMGAYAFLFSLLPWQGVTSRRKRPAEVKAFSNVEVQQLIPQDRVYAEARRPTVRITVSHDRPTEEVKRAVDRSFDDVLKAILILPIHLIQEHRAWQGNTLTFSLVAKKGLLSTPVKGTVEITDRDITFDVVLGFLERLISPTKAREVLTNRVKRLLN